MWGIAKLFNVNIRQFDAKIFFCPECLGCVNHKEKRTEFSKFLKKRGGWVSDFSFHKNIGVSKIGGVVLKKGI